MKTVEQLIPQAITQATGYTILHSLWQGILVAVLLTITLTLLHRQTAILRYRAALGALFIQLLLSAGTFGFYYNPATKAGQMLAYANIKATVLLQPVANQDSPLLSWESISLFFQAQLPLIVTVWLLGISFMLLRFLGGLVYLQRLRTYKNTPLSPQWQTKIDTLTARLQLNIAVRGAESGLVKTPLVIGFFKPLILLPLGALASLPVNQVEAILAHELAHIRRHDYFINLLQSLVEVLFFYHPAIWWISDFVRVERENCCDDLAIAICHDKLAYARALTALEEMKLQAPVLSLAFAGKDGSVLGRIKRLFQQPSIKPSFREGLLSAAILLLTLTLLSAAAVSNYTTKASVSQTTAIPKVPTQAIKVPEIEIVSFNDTDDSIKNAGEVIVYQDNKGKIVELFINGQKVPEDQLPNYQSFKLYGGLSLTKSKSFKNGSVSRLVGTKIIGNNTSIKKNSKNLLPAIKAPQKGVAPSVNTDDSTKKEGEVIIFQNKKGKVIELYIDGKKVPEEQLSNYKTFKLDRPLGIVKNTNYKNSDNYKKSGVSVLKGYNITGTNNSKVGVSKDIPPAPPHPENPKSPINPPVPPNPAPVAEPSPIKEVKAKITTPGKISKGSLHASNPMYFLNGKRIDKVAMDKLNPNTIQKIEVLKDGAATTLYGDAGKNGVVQITTKPANAKSLHSKKEVKPAAGTEDRKASKQATTIPKANPAKVTDTAKPDLDYQAKRDAVLMELKKDNLYSDDKLYTLKITNSGMYINNVKQSDALFQKYRKYLPYPDKNISNQTFEIKGRFTQK